MAQEQLPRLFQEFVWQMEQTAADLEPECAFSVADGPSAFILTPPVLLTHRNQADLIRFFAHLILFFRGLSQTTQLPALPLEPCTKILDAYVHILQLNDKPELVALYASQLQADNAVEAYAQFLACKSGHPSSCDQLLINSLSLAHSH